MCMEYPITLKYDDLEQIVEGWEKHKPTDTRKRKKNLEKLGQQYEYVQNGKGKGTTYTLIKKKFVGCGVKRKTEKPKEELKVHRTFKEIVYTGETIEDINVLVELTEEDYKIHDYVLSKVENDCCYNYIQFLEIMNSCPYETHMNWKRYSENTDSYQKQLAYIYRSLDLQELECVADGQNMKMYKVQKREEPLQLIDKRLKIQNFKKRQLDIGILMATIKEETDSMRVVKTMTEGGIVVYIKATDLFEDVGLVNESFKRNREYASYLEDYLPKEEQSLIYSNIHQRAKNSVESALKRLKRGGAISTHVYTYIMVTNDRKYIGLNNEQAVLIDKALELTVQDIAKEYPQVADRCVRGANFYNDFNDTNIEKFKWEKLREHIREHFPNYRSHMRAFGIGMVDTKVARYLNKRAKEEDMDLTEFIEQQHGFTHVESTELMTKKYYGKSYYAQKRKALVESCTVEVAPTEIMNYPIEDIVKIAKQIESCKKLLSDEKLTEEQRKEIENDILTYLGEQETLITMYKTLDRLDEIESSDNYSEWLKEKYEID